MSGSSQDELDADTEHVPVLDEATTKPEDQIYLQKVKQDSPNFLNHQQTDTKHLFRLTKKATENDRKVEYHNPKYPWIIGASLYPHLFQRPSDYGAVRIKLPAAHGGKPLKPGHYIVHYRWKGYSDCTDVNLHTTPMKEIDGVNNNAYVWNKIDHCQYQDPKQIVSRCHIASDSPDQCVRELTDTRKELMGQCGKQCNTRYGVNVVPLNNPKAVMFQDLVNIPFRNGTCANTKWTLLEGKETRSEKIDWSKWDKEEVVDQACSHVTSARAVHTYNAVMTLRHAVLSCSALGPRCSGFSVNKAFSVAQGGTCVGQSRSTEPWLWGTFFVPSVSSHVHPYGGASYARRAKRN